MLNYMSGEFLKLRKSISYKVMLIVFFVFAILDLLSIYYLNEHNSAYFDGYAFKAIDALPACIGSDNFFLIIGIFVCIFIIGDFSSGTIRQTISRGISRPTLFFGKLTLTYLSTFMFNIIMLLIYFVGSGLMYDFGSIEVNTGTYILRVIITLLLSNAVYTSLAFLFSTVSKNLGLSVTFICLLSFFGPLVVLLITYVVSDKFSNIWFSSATTQMLSQTISTTDFSLYGLYLFAFSAVCILISFLVFRKNEF